MVLRKITKGNEPDRYFPMYRDFKPLSNKNIRTLIVWVPKNNFYKSFYKSKLNCSAARRKIPLFDYWSLFSKYLNVFRRKSRYRYDDLTKKLDNALTRRHKLQKIQVAFFFLFKFLKEKSDLFIKNSCSDLV